MAKIKKVENIHEGKKYHHDQYMYMCPGCGYEHAIGLKAEGGNHTFNMDLDKPTFSPSVVQNHRKGEMCHSYIKEGMIQFLNDCTHRLKGQTVELPNID